MGKDDKIGRKIVFLTVGTTSFDALVKTVDTQQVRALLIEKGYTDLIIQLGRGSFKPSKIVELIFLGTLSDSEVRTTHKGSFSIHTAVDNNFRIKHSRKLNPSTRHNACWGDAKSPLGIAASGANSHQYWNAKGHSTGEDGALVVDYFTFSPTIVDHLRSASLVISHAGSGSIFETLHLGQPLIVVVNEDLMDNHQCELAEELAERKHLFYARPQTLHETLSNMDLQSLIPYPASDAMPVAKIITRFLGFPED